MAASGGHWLNLAEAQKLTQSFIVPGIMEEDIRRGGLVGRLPVKQITGTSLKWNREAVVASANRASVGSTLVWSEETTYNTMEATLKIAYKQTVLNNFVQGVYSSFNNYAAIQALEDRKALIRQIEDDLIYGDTTYGGSNQPDGLHALAQASSEALNASSNSLNIDEGEAGLQLSNLRALEREMKYGIDFFLFPSVIASRLDAFVQEAGMVHSIDRTASSAGTQHATYGSFQYTLDDLGKQVLRWNGIPIVRSDYLVAEQANTGVGSDARAKQSSGDNQYSVFAIKMGQVTLGEPGLTWCFGGDAERMENGNPIMVTPFEKLESFDARGLRQVVYHCLADGSSMCIGRIYDIEDVAIAA